MISIIIPTYNERMSLPPLIKRIFDVLRNEGVDGEVVVVDDNSPDGTAEIAKRLKKKYNVQVLIRKDKKGLSSAVLDGFDIARGEILGVMDADLSHPPEAIPRLLKPILDGSAELVIGSRYVEGGNIENWSPRRKITSKVATAIARPLTKVKDPMSGFFFLKRKVIDGAVLNPKGYKIGLEIVVKGNYRTIVEVPYTFKDREHGRSKLSVKEHKNYLSHVFSLYVYRSHLPYQFLKFCIVGGFGVLVNLAVLYSLVEFVYLWYMFAAVLAFIVAVTNNFVLNKIWTFGDEKKGVVVGVQYLKFFVVCVLGLSINLGVLYVLTQYGHLWYIVSQLTAIGIATMNNFVGSKFWAFR